jgi:hypothetical protein
VSPSLEFQASRCTVYITSQFQRLVVAWAASCVTCRWAPDQLYRVVSEVEHYHTFVPWCQKSTIKKRSADGKYLEAELEVGFQMLVER